MQAAVLDACVLYSAPLRDLLMRLAVFLYQPKWTEDIHEEWIRSVLADRPDLTRVQLDRTRELMNLNGGDCLVGYRQLIPTLKLPDPDDRHVLAAAIAAKASVIVTFNLSDFPDYVLSQYGMQAMHPDKFMLGLYNQNQRQFIEIMRLHRLSLKNPPKTVKEHLSTLDGLGLSDTVSILRNYVEEL